MAIIRNQHNASGIIRSKHTVSSVFHYGKLVWEAIKGFIFTIDGFSIQTKDGYIVKCSDQ